MNLRILVSGPHRRMQRDATSHNTLWDGTNFPFPSFILLSVFYRAMHVVLARYCYRKSSVRLSVRLSVRDVDVSWA